MRSKIETHYDPESCDDKRFIQRLLSADDAWYLLYQIRELVLVDERDAAEHGDSPRALNRIIIELIQDSSLDKVWV